MSSASAKARMSALVILFTIFLARSETATIWQPTHPIGGTASARVAQQVPDRLDVTRTKNLSNPAAPSFSETIADPSLVAKLYADIAALPPFPPGALNCPMSVGLTYHLDFYSEASSLVTADYEPTGCASVTLSDGTVKADPTRSFGADLRQALGFSSDASDRRFFGFQ
jgi:hypothetical protein